MKMRWFRVFPKGRSDSSWIPLSVLLLAMLPAPVYAIAICSVSATGMAFGGYNFRDVTPTIAADNVQVSCSLLGLISLLVSYEIRLSTGNSGSYIPRIMTSGANQLQYNLYTNAAHTIVWGDANSGTSTISDSYLLGIGTTVRNYSIYGRVPAGQNMPAGTYSDTITVTVNY